MADLSVVTLDTTKVKSTWFFSKKKKTHPWIHNSPKRASHYL